LQVVRREVELPWTEEDWRAGGRAGQQDEASRFATFLEDDRARGFELRQAPLIRCALLRTGEARWRFVWSFHHLVLDGWSLTRVLGEALSLYRSLTGGEAMPGVTPEGIADLLPRARPYRDYIGWLQSQDPARAEAFWRRELEGFSEPTPLPFELREAGKRAAAGGPAVEPAQGEQQEEIESRLSPELTARLETAAREAGLTLSSLVQGIWGVLQGRLVRRR
jgi:hypothetical protein